MGGKESKPEKCMSVFLSDEQNALHETFNKISGGNQETCKKDKLQAHWSLILDKKLSEKIIQDILVSSDGEVSFDRYILFAAAILKGPTDEQVEALWNILANTKGQAFTEALITFVGNISEAYFHAEAKTPTHESWNVNRFEPTATTRDYMAIYLLHDLVFKGKNAKETLYTEILFREHSRDAVEKWFHKCPLLRTMLITSFSEIYGLGPRRDSHLPLCKDVPPTPSFPSVLDYDAVLFLNSAIPAELRKEWRFLYSSKIHGESTSKLLGQIVEKGPTLIIVMDKNDHIFGGFASRSWNQGPKFVGSSECFLFHLAPRLALYNSTGYNSHYMYLNTQHKTLPNGLGMGGQMEYFGLWLDKDFGKGHCSPTCTTFDSPQLSMRQEFEIEHLEVWGVGPEPVKDEDERTGKSVLDSNLEDQAILAMAGRTPASVKEDRVGDTEN